MFLQFLSGFIDVSWMFFGDFQWFHAALIQLMVCSDMFFEDI